MSRVNDGVYDEEFKLSPIDENTFQLELDADNRAFQYSYSNKHSYGEEIRTPNFTITISKNEFTFDNSQKTKYAFVMNKLLAYYNEKMKIEPINKDATIVTISVQDKIKDRAVDFLNTLGKVYINRDVKDKSSVAALTLKFVDEQLEEISKTLNATELDLQKFKESKGTVNLSEESKAYLERVTSVDETRVKAEIDLKSLDYLYDYITSNLDLESLSPSTLNNPDPTLVELIAKLKELQNKRKSLSYGSSAQSPALKVIDEQIGQTKRSLVESINNLRNLTKTGLQGINS